MKNLEDLNNILFVQLERLSDVSLTGEALKEEMCRAERITGVADRVIANGVLVLRSSLAVPNSIAEVKMPRMLDVSTVNIVKKGRLLDV